MSKFEELCSLYAKSRKEYFDYESRCRKFAVELIRGLADYLEIPKDSREELMPLYPVNENPDPDRRYHIGGAMEFNSEDKFWHVGIGITVYEAPHVLPREEIRSEILIKGLENHFIVKFGKHSENEFVIHEDNADEFNKFFEAIFEVLKGIYDESIVQYVEKEDSEEVRYIQ